MASKITVAELLVDIGVDAKDANKAAEKFDKNLAKTAKTSAKLGDELKKLGKQFAIFSAAIGAAVIGVVKLVDSVTTVGDEVGKAAKQFGTGVEELQRLRFAADRSGASADTLSMALKNQARFMRDAQTGAVTPFTQALEEVNISLNDLASLKTPEERFGRIGEALRDVEDPAQRTALAMKLVGEESGPRLVPFLLEGRKGLRALGDEAQNLGLILSDDSVAASEAFQDTMTNAKSVVAGIKNTIALELLPAVDGAIKRFTEWAKANRGMIRQRVSDFLDKILKVAERLLPVFEALGKGVLFLVENFDTLLTIFVAGKTRAAFSAIAAGFSSIGVAAGAAFGPIGAIVSAMTVLIPLASKAGNALGDFLARDRTSRRVKRGSAPKTGARSVTGFKIAQESKTIREEEARLRRLDDQGLIDSSVANSARARRDAAAGRKAKLEVTRAKEFVTEKADTVDSEPITQGPLLPGLGDAPITATPERRAGKGGKKDAPVSAVTLQDVINRVIGGGDLGDLVRATPSVAEIKPTIALDITNITNNVEVKQDNRGTTDPKKMADLSAAKMRSVLQDVFRATGQKLSGGRVI